MQSSGLPLVVSDYQQAWLSSVCAVTVIVME